MQKNKNKPDVQTDDIIEVLDATFKKMSNLYDKGQKKYYCEWLQKYMLGAFRSLEINQIQNKSSSLMNVYLKISNDKYLLKTVDDCLIIPKKNIPLHIETVINGNHSCLTATYWKENWNMEFRKREYKVFTNNGMTILAEIWFN